MKKIMIIGIVVLMSIIIGCHSIPETKENSFYEIFTPPNFLVTEFNINYDNKILTFSMEYKFKEELHSLIKEENADISFIIVYPEAVSSIINKKESQIIKASKITDDKSLRYSVEFQESINNQLLQNQIDIIKEDMDYTLKVLDENNDVFTVINSFRHLTNYVEGISDSIKVD